MGFEYALIDFGNGRKLERFGELILDRPEVLATGNPAYPTDFWREKSHARFLEQGKTGGKWEIFGPIPKKPMCRFEFESVGWEFELHLGKFKHVGLFPEQRLHWEYLIKKVRPGDRVLNLFGYTGAASLSAAMAGGDVFHVDSSKSIVKKAGNIASSNGVNDIHWVIEDALTFAKREAKRGKKYRFILMDPPVYGRGKKGEHWRLEDKLSELLQVGGNLLEKKGVLILNTYSPKIGLNDMIEAAEMNDLKKIRSGWLMLLKNERKLRLSRYLMCASA